MLTQDYSPQIRTFGSLGYSPERIADLLGLSGDSRRELVMRLEIEGDELHTAYRHGLAIGNWNIDAELSKQAERGDLDAIKLRSERSKERKVADVKKEKFGI